MLLLIALKLVQVADGDGRISWEGVAYGLRRRLDDPSFWALFATCIAVLMITRATARLERCFPRKTLVWPSRSLLLAWLVPALALSSAYLLYSADQEENLFHPGPSAAVQMIQRIEGVSVLCVLFAACFAFSVGLRWVFTIRDLCRTGGRTIRQEGAMVEASRLIASAGAGPAVAAGLAVAVTGLLFWVPYCLGWSRGSPNWLNSSDVIKLALSLALYFLPFIALTIWTVLMLDWRGKHFRFFPTSSRRGLRTYWLRFVFWFGRRPYRFARRVVNIADAVLMVLALIPIIPLDFILKKIAPFVATWEPLDAKRR